MNVASVVIRTLFLFPVIVEVVSTFMTALPWSLISMRPADCFEMINIYHEDDQLRRTHSVRLRKEVDNS